jgi:S1-C subfamily serine protease
MRKARISDLKGIGAKKTQALIDAGFKTIDDLKHASLKELTDVEGIGIKQANAIKRELKRLAIKSISTIEKDECKDTKSKTDMPTRTSKTIPHHRSLSPIFFAILVITLCAAGTIIGGLVGHHIRSEDIVDLNNQFEALQQQFTALKPYQNITYYYENSSLSELYKKVNSAIVSIHAFAVQSTFFGTIYSEVGGSGFFYNFSGQLVVVTNYHVVHNTVNITITLANGSAYPATVLGSDPYADLAVLSVEAQGNMFETLPLTSSFALEVGDPVIAIGNPFGLTGSMTTGIVSQLGRTIKESIAGNFAIANIIQISTPINPGNSGGPLLNYRGEVVGITTAIIEESQGVGFAIPSSTILREIASLVNTGTYNQHAWLGVTGVDMSYEISQAMDINETYGWLIAQVVDGGPADEAGIRGGAQQVQIAGSWYVIGGDLIIALDDKPIITGDDLMSYLEAYCVPGQVVNTTIIRGNQSLMIPIELGTRPPPN